MTVQDCNLYAHFAKQFAAHSADELLLTDAGRSYSYADIDRESARLTRYLTGLGIKTGHRVSVQVDKSVASLAP